MSNTDYKIQIRDQAAFEFSKAFIWYNEQKEGLGEEFASAVQGALNKVANNPYHYKKTYKNYHEALVDKFPFLIVYVVKENGQEIIVIAIFHTSRNPKAKYRK